MATGCRSVRKNTLWAYPPHLRGIVPLRALGSSVMGFVQGHRDDRRERYRPTRKRGETPAQVGNLNNNDYRFWIGCSNPASEYSMCRACGTICFNSAHRFYHKETEKCTDILVEVYKLALRERLCLVCEKSHGQGEVGLARASGVRRGLDVQRGNGNGYCGLGEGWFVGTRL
jgi:ferredoxin